MAEIPTADEAFGNLPSADEAFGPELDPGFAARSYLAAKDSLSRVVNTFGVGAREGFGEEPIATPSTVFSPETEKALRDYGVFNDYTKGQADFSRAMFEGVFRPAAAALSLAGRTFSAGLSSVAEAASQEVEETGLVPKGSFTGSKGLVGALQDPSMLMAFPLAAPEATAAQRFPGASGKVAGFAEGHAADFGAMTHEEGFTIPLEKVLAKARADGVLGEGEAGYYDAVPLTPEHAQARMHAAEEAGDHVPIPQPAPTDIHGMARRVDPDTMQQYDELTAQRDRYRQAVADLANQREALPEAAAAKQEIDTILGKVHGVEDRLTKKQAERLADAQGRLETALHEETPAMAKARKLLLEADYAMRDLAPAVSAAYRRAGEIVGDAEVTPTANLEAASKGEPPLLKNPEPAAYPSRQNLDVVSGKAHADEMGQIESDAVAGLAKPAATVEGAARPEIKPTVGGKPVGYGNLRPIEGTGDLIVRKLAEGVEARAIQSDLVDHFGDLPEYRQLSMAEQAKQAGLLLSEDYERAKDVAMGLKQPPKGLLPESVFVAVEKRALAEGDVETLRELATGSKLTKAATTMGQRIRTLGERDPSSPIGAIQEVQDARRADLERRSGDTAIKDAINSVRTEMRRSSATMAHWEDFIKAITCEGE